MMLKQQQLRLLLIILRHLKQQLYSKDMDFLASIDLSPLLISLKTAIIATVVAFFGGIACARWAMKLKPLSKSILDGILNLPLVLPPTVAGFLLLLLHRLYLVGNLFPKRINWQWKSPPMFVHRVGPCRNCRLLLRVGWEQLISPVYELNLS